MQLAVDDTSCLRPHRSEQLAAMDKAVRLRVSYRLERGRSRLNFPWKADERDHIPLGKLGILLPNSPVV